MRIVGGDSAEGSPRETGAHEKRTLLPSGMYKTEMRVPSCVLRTQILTSCQDSSFDSNSNIDYEFAREVHKADERAPKWRKSGERLEFAGK